MHTRGSSKWENLLTYRGEHGERVEKCPGEIPLVVDDFFASDVVATAVRHRVLRCPEVVGERPHHVFLKTGYLLGGQPRPVLMIQNIELLRRDPQVLHRVSSGLVYLKQGNYFSISTS